ncbi:P-loop containing nucleoside triphosphate hydrolase protein [Wallemia mellicola]|uniref:Structural maintenance of chromosomes protein 5 n=1 Tax=Wallemia mellicola TaxID=1708541 RepID=A0A4T0U5P9_9BASI|nr:hypothetical protein E3Q23_03248 [Wallemia mellicola]TIB88623.1 P-loop containing nucleoside triphosphate hydrolase protein [Wallemia mellicola]TIB95990.1 P-loop containing nucleoside triphosphate hydrolase protein [Wallemia mellicola]TIC09731.1 P-loop containing nucleoside triphosphate hydrolase protein [Wallemia mellicola]TIC28323.1 P-loop containing nucleoside triphosphate hydrolase protein [Wallemia mellicola]
MARRTLKRRAPSTDEDDSPPTNKTTRQVSDDEDIGTTSLSQRDEGTNDDDNELAENDEDESDDADVKPTIMDQEYVAEALQPQERQRDADNFIPGSITRVVLHNFLTYDHVDFCPGPYLNMIIGPNGTGKSTIVCGIALGLGAGPKILGRSSDVNAFVKQDKTQGYIEIHLKAKNRHHNHVIKRSINSTDKQSKYEVDGEPSRLEVIKEIVSSYGIQIGNLCSFLPQDKVSQFAQMSPSTLLLETQKVAEGTGIGNLTEWHKKLIESGKTLNEAENDLNSMIKDRNDLEEMNKSQEREIERYRARKSIEKKVGILFVDYTILTFFQIDLLNLMIPFSRYSQSKTQYDQAKANRKRLNENVIKIERENLPLKQKISDFEKLIKESEDKRKDNEEDIQRKRQEMKEVGKQLEQFVKHTEDATSKIEDAERADQRRLESIDSAKQKIAALENTIADPPNEEGLREFEDQIRTIRQSISELHEFGKKYQDIRREVASEKQEIYHEQSRYERILLSMDNVRQRRYEKFRSFDETTARTVEIINKNKDKFQEKVYDPAFLEVKVKDQSYAAAIESLINYNVMKTILCQNQEDYDIATKQIIDKYKFRVNIVQPVFSSRDTEPLMTREEIRQLGFDGFAIDFIDAPEFIINYLKKSCFLHKIPVAKTADQVNLKAIEESSAFKKRELRRYLIGTESHSYNWSRYGKQAASTTTTFVRPSRVFNDTNADIEERQELEARIEEYKRRASEQDQKIEELIPKEKDLHVQERTYKGEIQRLDEQKSEIQRKRQEYFKAQATLHSTKKNLQKLENMPSSAAEKQKYKTLICKITKQRIDEVETYTELVKELTQLIEKSELLVLEEVQYDANRRSLNGYLNGYNITLSEASRELSQADEHYKSVKAESTRYLKIAQNELAQASEELRNDFVKFRERVSQTGDEQSLEELEDALAVEKTNLEMNSNVSASIIEMFEHRKKVIEEQTQKIKKKQIQFDNLKASIDRIRSKWEPTLLKLIMAVSERFSKAFERFGCAGEVKLFRHATDYAQWAIEIYVKFRETENLELLTHQRQSGGERSLSTILYLMSLTELSKSPFSLVDEINQGMDSRAERLVHNQMVQVTCRDYSSQYFLITPKLLPNLTYHPKMKVLCVNNGEWLDEKRGNLKLLLKEHKDANAGIANGTQTLQAAV